MHLKVYANHMKGVQVTEIIYLHCNSPSQIHLGVYFRLKNSMTGGAYMGDVLKQIWLKSMKK